jgi:hypothetical protein
MNEPFSVLTVEHGYAVNLRTGRPEVADAQFALAKPSASSSFPAKVPVTVGE